MVGTATGRVALFSIHPRYAEAILDGSKQVEFRRQGLPEDVTHVVIYATAPVQRIIGVFEVAGVEKQSPQEAWAGYQAVGAIEKEAFDRYYEGTESAFVIKVRNPKAFEVPFALGDVDESLRPPQSYMYLRDHLLDRANALGARHIRRQSRVLRPLSGVLGKVLTPSGR
jgi:predicted transcriptional regulator